LQTGVLDDAVLINLDDYVLKAYTKVGFRGAKLIAKIKDFYKMLGIVPGVKINIFDRIHDGALE
jgi:hypothetical protein